MGSLRPVTFSGSTFMRQSIPPVPIPPPPWADPWALAFFLPWMANSRGGDS